MMDEQVYNTEQDTICGAEAEETQEISPTMTWEEVNKELKASMLERVQSIHDATPQLSEEQRCLIDRITDPATPMVVCQGAPASPARREPHRAAPLKLSRFQE